MPFCVFKLFKFSPKDLLIDSISSINTDIMNFLSIDCSTDISSLFIKTKNKSFSKILQSDKFNSDLLMKQILDFLQENNLRFDDLSKIFVNQGPGNYSGLRASLAIAKGVSISKKLNLFGYNTFIWSSSKFFNKKDYICSITYFRKKFYIKKFNKKLQSISHVLETSENEIITKYKNTYKVIPKYAEKYFSEKVLKITNLSIVDLDHNELEFLNLKGLLNEDLIKPLYLS